MESKVKEVLSKVYGHHSFRPGQEELVRGLLDSRDVLGIMPTGSGNGTEAPGDFRSLPEQFHG